MLYVYVLLLSNSKYYITNYERKVSLSKFTLTHKNEWLNKYKIINIDELFTNCSCEDVNKITKIYVDKYGIENVRNVYYANILLDDEFVNVMKDIRIKLTESKITQSDSRNNKYKKVWFCDVCGEDFDNFNDAYNHERKHNKNYEQIDVNLCCYFL